MKLRLPADLKDRLSELATANGRSLNAEVLLRLEASVADEVPIVGCAQPADDRTLDLIAEKVGEVLDQREKRPARLR
ncbi:Arc family DNA-binding protein [Burkholderia multivorans]|nr:Arc family DNA-binding protein [Burkholderia multivorans]MBU9259697.1 Arc family DNA-binding protein [Burkholderia multivorans]MBU9490128.1 Arc family DNA-binding protein [Burkholderia multivorans]MBU9544789.1 Arc family DNA-binding protein [Burkholderia multivorans]HDV6320861.1 Arc family DNA-binding protein [Burkholderia multivorans]